MSDHEPYPSASGVESAIKAAASKAVAADPSLNVSERIRLEYFARFLSRVFSEGVDSAWLLTGGTGMLARLPSARATRDIDLYRDDSALDRALADLRRLADVDLGDHFRFVYSGHSRVIGGEEQPYTDGYRVGFDVYIGVQKKSSIHVDLTTGPGPTASPTYVEPANVLVLPRLVSYKYRLCPVVDQVADKVCATMNTYGNRPSSREKDLVDLVVLAVTHDVDGTALGVAILTEASRRRMESLTGFGVPQEWGRGYARLAEAVPYCADYPTVERAQGLISRFIDPVLAGTADGRIWSHDRRDWT